MDGEVDITFWHCTKEQAQLVKMSGETAEGNTEGNRQCRKPRGSSQKTLALENPTPHFAFAF
jgi:hypothetical protein